jgi:hypothetical protein
MPTRLPEWSFLVALAIVLAPIVGAIVAAWIELSTPGDSPMWIVAGAFFLACPGVAAVAARRTDESTMLRTVVAIVLAGALFTIWIVNVPLPTHPGVYAGGSSRLSGAVMSALVALAWFIASGRSMWWIRRGRPRIGFVVGAATLVIVSAGAFFAGSII